MQLVLLFLSCKQKNDNSELSESISTEARDTILNPDEEKIKATINELLFAAGNYNLVALDSMM